MTPKLKGLRLWLARLSRLWKGYLRVAKAAAQLLGGVLLTVQYFVVLPAFAMLAKRAARRLPAGWTAARRSSPLHSPY